MRSNKRIDRISSMRPMSTVLQELDLSYTGIGIQLGCLMATSGNLT